MQMKNARNRDKDSAFTPDSSCGLDKAVSLFDPVDLAELGPVDLMDRKDTKYLCPAEELPAMLHGLAGDYRILSINDGRVGRYASLYFDTDGFRFYREHHNGKMNRHKVRRRKYVESALHFVELKHKSNKGNTRKRRMEIGQSCFASDFLSETERAFVSERLGSDPGELRPVLFVEYSRLTLVDNEFRERVTIDLDLVYSPGENGTEITAPGKVVIVEVKQDRRAKSSNVKKMMVDRRIKPVNFSKYCFGVNMLYPGVKRNRFKARNMAYNKLALAYRAGAA